MNCDKTLIVFLFVRVFSLFVTQHHLMRNARKGDWELSEDRVSDQTPFERIQEIMREQMFLHLAQEVCNMDPVVQEVFSHIHTDTDTDTWNDHS